MDASPRSATTTAYIAMGANLGRREDNIRQALASLGERGVSVTAVSCLIETDPVGGPAGQGKYLNGAARIETSLKPHELLSVMLDVERDLGRTREPGQRDLPRQIDLDLLLFGDCALDDEGLCVPHPRMHERIFVLQPLAEIAPNAIHPTQRKTVSELLEELKASQT